MRNQPKYNLFKNTSYALCGLKDLVKNESSFKIELVLSIFLILFVYIIEISLLEKLFMITSIFGVLIAETINSAIERNVDLVTQDFHEMAKRAKDMGSAIVFLSIALCVCTWGLILINNYIY